MCGDGNHQGFIADTSVTRRTVLLTMTAAAAASGIAVPAFAEDAGAKPVTEKDVSVKTAGGSADAALFYPSGKGQWPAVLMWPDILGLRPVFREMGKRLAAQGYLVLVPNPYYRARKAPVVEGPFDFSNKDDRAKIRGFREGLTDAMVAGMLPIALSITGDASWRAPMGVTVIGGLIFSTMLTLLLVPAYFSIAISLESRIGRLFHRLVGEEAHAVRAPLPAE